MGQKVSPIGLRIGINKTWESKWYAGNKDFARFLNNDVKIRKLLTKKLKDAAVSSILIERNAAKTEVIINTAKPGVVIGHSGDEIEKLKKELQELNEKLNVCSHNLKTNQKAYEKIKTKKNAREVKEKLYGEIKIISDTANGELKGKAKL